MFNWQHVDIDRLNPAGPGNLAVGSHARHAPIGVNIGRTSTSTGFELSTASDRLRLREQATRCRIRTRAGVVSGHDVRPRPHLLRRRQPHHGAAGFPAAITPIPTCATHAASLRAARRHARRAARGDARAGQAPQPPAQVAELIALGDELIAGPKGYRRWAPSTPTSAPRRSTCSGFHRQLVFATFSAGVAFSTERADRGALRGRPRAQPRDGRVLRATIARLLGVGAAAARRSRSWPSPNSSTSLELGLQRGLGAAPPVRRPLARPRRPRSVLGARSPRPACRSCCTSAAQPLQIDAKAWMNTGRAVPTDWLGGGENVRGKDMTILHHPPRRSSACWCSTACSSVIRALRGGVIELGAGWVPSMLTRLDWVAEIWSKSRPELQRSRASRRSRSSSRWRSRRTSFEDVGDLIRQSDSRPVSVLQRLSAHRRRPRSARALRGVARGPATTLRRRISTPKTSRGCSASPSPFLLRASPARLSDPVNSGRCGWNRGRAPVASESGE